MNKKEVLSEYDIQAESFLKKCGVVMEAVEAVPQDSPTWAEDGNHGIKWSITLHKGDINGKTIQFFFWSSIYDLVNWEEQKKNSYGNQKHPKPRPYSVLASIYTTDANDGFDWFCEMYGYDKDSRKAFQSFALCIELNKKLESIFSSDELSELSEIQ